MVKLKKFKIKKIVPKVTIKKETVKKALPKVTIKKETLKKIGTDLGSGALGTVVLGPLGLAPEALRLGGELIEEIGGDPGKFATRLKELGVETSNYREAFFYYVLDQMQELEDELQEIEGNDWQASRRVHVRGWDLKWHGTLLAYRPIIENVMTKHLSFIDAREVKDLVTKKDGSQLAPWGGIQDTYSITYVEQEADPAALDLAHSPGLEHAYLGWDLQETEGKLLFRRVFSDPKLGLVRVAEDQVSVPLPQLVATEEYAMIDLVDRDNPDAVHATKVTLVVIADLGS